MNSLPQDILYLLLFGVPGVFMRFLVYNFTDIPRKDNIDWKITAIYSFINIYILYLITLLANKIKTNIDPIELKLDTIISTYMGIPVLILVMLVSLAISVLLIFGYNKEWISKLFGSIRKKFNLKVESSLDVWSRKVKNRDFFVAKVVYLDREEYGIINSISTKRDLRQIYLKTPKIFVKRPDIVKNVLGNMVPDGKYFDFNNSFMIVIYDRVEFAKKIKRELKK